MRLPAVAIVACFAGGIALGLYTRRTDSLPFSEQDSSLPCSSSWRTAF
jgi:hypothetical protein